MTKYKHSLRHFKVLCFNEKHYNMLCEYEKWPLLCSSVNQLQLGCEWSFPSWLPGFGSKALQYVCVLVRVPTRQESTSWTESSVGHEAFTGKSSAVLLYSSIVWHNSCKCVIRKNLLLKYLWNRNYATQRYSIVLQTLLGKAGY